MQLKRAAVLIVVVLSILVAQPLSAQPRYFEFTCLTTNDLHANLQPFHVVDGRSDVSPSPNNVGGAARRATIIRQVRSQASCPVFVLDSGDTTFGVVPTARAFRGAADVEVLNTIGYDAMAAGNHDFEWQSPDTLRNLKASRFPWICANLVDEKTGKPFLQTHVIREVGGVRIAFFALVAPLIDNPRYKAARELGLKYADATKVAAKLVPELRKQADIVILLSHLGATPDTQLAAAVPGIDAIFGGHSHTRLAQPRWTRTGEPTAFSIGAVPVTQSGRWGEEMGRIRLIFRRDSTTGRYTLMSFSSQLVRLDSSVPEDPVIAGIIQRYVSQIKPEAAAAK